MLIPALIITVQASSPRGLHVAQVLGVLNTVTGHIETCAKLRKFFGVPKPRARAAATLPRNYLQSLKQRGRVWRPAALCMLGDMPCNPYQD